MSRIPVSDRRLDWLVETLWEGSDHVRAVVNGPVPDGFEPAQRFLVVPSAEQARFLLPAESIKAAASSIRLYNALRSPGRRLTRALLALALRRRVTRWALRDRLTVCVSTAVPVEVRHEILLGEHLRRTLPGHPHLLMAIGIGRRGPFRKPVLQLLSSDGRALGYAKVGWNEVTRLSVRREAGALGAWAGRDVSTRVPALIHHGSWGGLELTVTSPLPPRIRRHPRRELPPLSVLREIASLGPVTQTTVAQSAQWRGIRDRLAAAGAADPALGGALAECLDRVEDRYGEVRLAFGWWHGDLSPWNIGRAGGRVFVWDWEQSGPDVALGSDLLHYRFQLSFIDAELPVGESVRRLMHEAPALLAPLEVGHPGAHATVGLYVLELTLRYLESAALGAPRAERFLGEIGQVLARIPPAPDTQTPW
jgi:hypothetical protein